MILSNSRSLIEDIAIAKSKGFTEEFIFFENMIKGRNNKQSYNNTNCRLIESCVHEGLSDPSDQSILFLIECDDNTKGCLSSAYGIYAETELLEFCLSLEKDSKSR